MFYENKFFFSRAFMLDSATTSAFKEEINYIYKKNQD